MLRFALVENSIVVGVTPCESVEIIQTFTGTWIDVTPQPEIGIGWIHLGGNNFEAPPEPAPVYRQDMTIAEWTATFTPSEWEQSENAAYVPGFVLDGAAVSDAVRQEWRQYLDVIKANIPGPGQGQRAVNVLQPPVDNYYTFLVAQGFITEARKDELQAGIL